jgi:ribosomal protein S18 acetylase RimI-like enzyme
MSSDVEVVAVDATNVAEQGFFCRKSKRKSEGNRRKLNWLNQRFSEGMKIKILYEHGRSVGFIEYIPGEFAWRAVKAKGYMVIHCLWVVGKSKGKGYGSRLLNECMEDARKMQKHGVVMVTSSRVWLAGKELLLKHGFEPVDEAPPSFELLARKFGDAPPPAFPRDWDKRSAHYGSGLTVIRSDQCPYIDDAAKTFLEAAGEMGLQARVVELENCQEVQGSAPSAYGVFNVVYEGKLLTYHYLLKKELLKLLGEHPH